MADKNWADGLFLREFDGKFGMMMSLGFDKEQFIQWLDEQEPNENGFVNVIAGPAQEAPRWNAWLAEERQASTPRRQSRTAAPARQKAAPQRNTRTAAPAQRRAAAKPQQRRSTEPEYAQEEATDDLPF